jgi:hypothetical protein
MAIKLRNKSRLKQLAERNGSPFCKIFGCMRGSFKIVGDIVSPDPELWDCELGIAYCDENGVAFDYNGNEVDMVGAAKNAR